MSLRAFQEDFFGTVVVGFPIVSLEDFYTLVGPPVESDGGRLAIRTVPVDVCTDVAQAGRFHPLIVLADATRRCKALLRLLDPFL